MPALLIAWTVLALDTPDDAPVDPYELDRRYWESLWHRSGE